MKKVLNLAVLLSALPINADQSVCAQKECSPSTAVNFSIEIPHVVRVFPDGRVIDNASVESLVSKKEPSVIDGTITYSSP